GERVAIAGVFPGVRGDLPGLADTSGGQDSSLRLEYEDVAAFQAIGHGTRDALAVLQQARDRALHKHVDPLVHGVLLERAYHLQARAVADMGKPSVAMAAEVTLQDATVLRAVEERAPTLQFVNPVRRLLRVQLRHTPVVQHLAAA